MLLQTYHPSKYLLAKSLNPKKIFFPWKSLQAFPSGRRNANNATAIQLGPLLFNCQAVELSTQIFKTPLCLFKYPTKENSHPNQSHPRRQMQGIHTKSLLVTTRIELARSQNKTEQTTIR